MAMRLILLSEESATTGAVVRASFRVGPVVLVWVLLTFLLGVLIANLAIKQNWPMVEEQMMEARLEERGRVMARSRQGFQSLIPALADMHLQLLQLEAQGGRMAALAGMQNDWRERGLPEDSSTLARLSLGVDDLKKELEFATRQLELKADEMSMVEFFILEQRMHARNAAPYGLPVPGLTRISSGYGLRPDPFTGERRMHAGIDFEAREGSPIFSVADGLVARVVALPDYGNLVEINHRDGLTTRYAHLQTPLVRMGQAVRRGETIGTAGSTGRSTAPHLHFEVLELGVKRHPLAFFLSREVADRVGMSTASVFNEPPTQLRPRKTKR
jgi:murein DD-endopeptidase MepM/ murein hydrolase activator NlpD